MGQRLPLRLRWQHVRCARDSCRPIASAKVGSLGPLPDSCSATFEESEGLSTGARIKIDVPPDANIWVHGDWLAAKLRTSWTIAGETFKPDSVIGIPFAIFLGGGRHFAKLFEPEDRRALQTLFWASDWLILSILDDLKPAFEALTPNEGAWACETLTRLPEIGSANVDSLA
jgi:prolyl oligopeptidase